MSEPKVRNALERCDRSYGYQGSDLMSVFDEWAKDYDNDYGNLGYEKPSQMSALLLKYIDNDAKVIDIACGTGLVGACLRKHGFTGKLDGVDGSQQMLDVAKGKGIYDELHVQFLNPGEPVKTTSNTKYNGLICVGSIIRHHLGPRHVVDFLDVLEKGGVMAFSVRDASYNKEILEELMPLLKELEEGKKIAKLEETIFSGSLNARANDIVEAGLTHIKPDDYSGDGTTKVFCYRKL